MADIIQIRRGTSTQWTSTNPVLADGELGFETDTKKGKLGNGVDNWSTLTYSFSGVTTQFIDQVNAATGKTTPADADLFGISDVAGGSVLKKLTWANVKATLKTYFDTLYVGSASVLGTVLTGLSLVTATTISAADSILTALGKLQAQVTINNGKISFDSTSSTRLANTSGTNTGNETATTTGALISGSTAKTTPVDADSVAISDSAASNVLKKVTWANIKATLKTYFDTFYGFLGVPQNSKSAAYTLVLADAGNHILHPSADTTARTFTIPANASVAFPIGSAITFVNQNGAGVVTIAITTDTMRLAGAGTTGSRTLAANGVATALKITSTEWIISGINLT